MTTRRNAIAGGLAIEASLAIPAARDAIRQAMPMIAGFDTLATTRPIGGMA